MMSSRPLTNALRDAYCKETGSSAILPPPEPLELLSRFGALKVAVTTRRSTIGLVTPSGASQLPAGLVSLSRNSVLGGKAPEVCFREVGFNVPPSAPPFDAVGAIVFLMTIGAWSPWSSLAAASKQTMGPLTGFKPPSSKTMKPSVLKQSRRSFAMTIASETSPRKPASSGVRMLLHCESSDASPNLPSRFLYSDGGSASFFCRSYSELRASERAYVEQT
mmetsp:Transcript_18642/g.55149  ORF Transcript_18642/g.55149 Transcript_18642/m.55149 type:complete len:220 (-) Transcript_18642:1757-2416(-)